METELKIKCPHCGREYLPCEIYYPNDFLGNAGEIFKDENGKIITYSGDNMNLDEIFTCDCGCEFKVSAHISFTAVNLDDDCSVELFSDRTELDEGEDTVVSLWDNFTKNK